MQLTDELRVIVEAEVSKAVQSFEKLNAAVDKSEKKTRSLSDAIDKMKGATAVIGAAFAGAGVAAVKMAGNLEQTQLALEVLLRDADKATEIKNEWTELAAETPFSSSDIDSAGKKLLAFNISAKEVTETLRRIGDISAATGSSISEIADIYGKAAVQGRLFAEDINQFQGRGIPVVQALAKVLGVAETEVRDLVTQGKVGFPELEAAFKAMTDEGGQFSGMMEKLSTSTLGRFSSVMDNAELAIASFGSVMLDTVNDVLDAGDDFFQWLQDVDDGTKRFIITFSGVSAGVAGALVAIKSLTGAFAALAANPLVLGAVAAAAGIGLIVAAVNKANHRLEDAASEIAKTNQKQKELLDSFANGDAAKKLDAKTTKKLIELYPELSGEIKAYSTSVEEASEAVKKLNREKIAESAEGDLRKLRRMLAEVGETEQYAAQKADEYLKHMTDLSIAAANGEIKEDQIPDLSRIQKINRDSARERLKEAKAEYEAYFAELDAYLKTAGMTLTDDLRVIDLPKVEIEAPETGNAAVEEDAIKTWQEWFRKVTGVEGAFETGQEAGRLYAEGLASEAEHKAALSDLLGFDTRASEEIRAQMEDVLSDIENLLAIPADKIDEQFTLADTSVQSLAASYRELAAAAEKAEMAEEVSDTLAELRKRVEELGKSETELTLAMLEAKGATEAQMEEAKALLEKLNETEIDPLGSWQEILAQKLSAALEELELFSAETNKILTDLGVQLASIAFDGALSGLSALGEALAQGGDAASSLGDALAAMADQILQQLPTLFLQAGLTLIAQGNLPLGIGLLAAAGVASFMTGVVEGFSGEEDDDEENAKGGVYGDGRYAAFAKGGAFTNGIVTSPTRFRFAKGAGFGRGLMGEAGPEAIMPLKRMSDGSLGVAAQSAGGADGGIVVVINNYSSEEVSATETAGEGGARKLEVTIGQMINSHISSGRADKAIGGRFGLRAKGV